MLVSTSLGNFTKATATHFALQRQSEAELQFAAASPRVLDAMYVSYHATLIYNVRMISISRTSFDVPGHRHRVIGLTISIHVRTGEHILMARIPLA